MARHLVLVLLAAALALAASAPGAAKPPPPPRPVKKAGGRPGTKPQVARAVHGGPGTGSVVPTPPPPVPKSELLTSAVGKRAAYGHLIVAGATSHIEYFRAVFGGLIPCEPAPLLFAEVDNPTACPPVPANATAGNAPAGEPAAGNATTDAPSASPAAEPVPVAPSTLPRPYDGAYLVARRGGCSFLAKAAHAQAGGAVGLIVTSADGVLLRVGFNVTNREELAVAEGIRIPVVLVAASRLAPFAAPPCRLPGANASAAAAPADNTDGGEECRWWAALRPKLDECLPAPQPKQPAPAATAAAKAQGEGEAADEGSDPLADGLGGEGASEEGPAEDGAAVDGAAAEGTEPDKPAASPYTIPLPHPAPPAELKGWAAAPVEAEMGTLQWRAAQGSEAAAVGADGSAASAPGPLSTGTAEFATALFSGPLRPGLWAPLVAAEPFDACSALSQPTPGAIVLVARGTCTMHEKARNVVAAGGAGAVFVSVPNEECAAAARNGTLAEAGAASPEATAAALCGLPVAQPIADKDNDTLAVSAVLVGREPGTALQKALAAAQGAGGLVVRLVPSAARATWWDDLLLSMRSGRSAWPEDPYHVHRSLLEALGRHHPATPAGTGDAGRLRFLAAVATGAGLLESGAWGAALEDWLEGAAVGKTRGMGSGRRPPANATRPASFYLLRGVAPSWRSMDKYAEGPLRCRSEAGRTWIAPVPEHEPGEATEVQLTYRIRDMLAAQACFEKLAVANAQVLGRYLASLREGSGDRDWRRITRALLGPYGVPEAQLAEVSQAFITAGELPDGE